MKLENFINETKDLNGGCLITEMSVMLHKVAEIEEKHLSGMVAFEDSSCVVLMPVSYSDFSRENTKGITTLSELRDMYQTIKAKNLKNYWTLEGFDNEDNHSYEYVSWELLNEDLVVLNIYDRKKTYLTEKKV